MYACGSALRWAHRKNILRCCYTGRGWRVVGRRAVVSGRAGAVDAARDRVAASPASLMRVRRAWCAITWCRASPKRTAAYPPPGAGLQISMRARVADGWRPIFALCGPHGYETAPPVGWLEFFLQATETCPNSEKNINCSSSNGFGPTLTTMTKLFSRWPAILTKLSAGFPATVCRPSKLFWVNSVVVFFDTWEGGGRRQTQTPN